MIKAIEVLWATESSVVHRVNTRSETPFVLHLLPPGVIGDLGSDCMRGNAMIADLFLPISMVMGLIVFGLVARWNLRRCWPISIFKRR